MRLSRFPRVRLCHSPTPLEPMENLTRLLGGPTLYVKRDDCTGLATGGNKTRKLDFLMGDALARRADTVVTQGAVQSNHVRQTAAAAAKLGLKCEILLERRVPNVAEDYDSTGNVFLDRLFGASIGFRPAGLDMNAACEELAEELRRRGAAPYVIPGGGSNRVGALGYVNAALELVTQANEAGLRIDYVVHATGSAGTQAGLLVGLEGCNSGIKVLGISVRHPKNKQEEVVYNLAAETADYVGVSRGLSRDCVVASGDYVGPGYGQLTPETAEAIRTVARQEGVLLDPVYSGKGMAGLIALIRRGFFSKDDNVVFVHTGGSAALFAYPSVVAEEAA
ncbi:MAG: D-cysteine desulfhydrase [Kiloniellaceae bacterium]